MSKPLIEIFDEIYAPPMSRGPHFAHCPTCGQQVPAQHEEILTLIGNGVPIAEIAAQVGVSARQIQRIAAAYGQARPKGRPKRLPPSE